VALQSKATRVVVEELIRKMECNTVQRPGALCRYRPQRSLLKGLTERVTLRIQGISASGELQLTADHFLAGGIVP
jgi:hypothetical protein